MGLDGKHCQVLMLHWLCVHIFYSNNISANFLQRVRSVWTKREGLPVLALPKNVFACRGTLFNCTQRSCKSNLKTQHPLQPESPVNLFLATKNNLHLLSDQAGRSRLLSSTNQRVLNRSALTEHGKNLNFKKLHFISTPRLDLNPELSDTGGLVTLNGL